MNDVDDDLRGTHCSLREAIKAANAQSGMDTITFDDPLGGPFRISPTSAFPAITDPTVSMGPPSQDTGPPIVELSGAIRHRCRWGRRLCGRRKSTIGASW